jgi:hypothetical protein
VIASAAASILTALATGVMSPITDCAQHHEPKKRPLNLLLKYPRDTELESGKQSSRVRFGCYSGSAKVRSRFVNAPVALCRTFAYAVRELRILIGGALGVVDVPALLELRK